VKIDDDGIRKEVRVAKVLVHFFLTSLWRTYVVS
jgi:hypothetical protein